MNKAFPITLVLISLTALSTVDAEPLGEAVPNSWVSKAPMHVARSSLGVAVVNGKIYAIGGANGSELWPNVGRIMGTNEEYDPATNTWTYKAPMPTQRYGFAIAVYENKIYCIGGIKNYTKATGYEVTGANEVYNPITNTWETKTSMRTPRSHLAANVVHDKIYLIGAATLNEVYDPASDSWTTKAPMPNEASGYASAVFDNRIYIFGGLSEDNLHVLNQIYDPETNRWSYGASPPNLPSSLYGRQGNPAAAATTGAMANKRIYYIVNAVPYSVQIYNPESDSWSNGTSILTNRGDLGVAVLIDTLHAIGGSTCHYLYPDDTFGVSVAEYAVNEQYTPLGYGTPDPSYQSPSPSPAPSLSLSPTPTPTQTPTLPPSLQTPNPSASPSPQATENTVQSAGEFPFAAAAVAIVAVVSATVFALFLRKKRK